MRAPRHDVDHSPERLRYGRRRAPSPGRGACSLQSIRGQVTSARVAVAVLPVGQLWSWRSSARVPTCGRRRAPYPLGLLAVATLAATGCDLPGFGAPDPKSEQGESIFSLWQGFFVAAIAVGALVWGLLIFVILRYRRARRRRPQPEPATTSRSRSSTPRCPSSSSPCCSASAWRPRTTSPTLDPDPVATIDVIGFQWPWQFRYPTRTSRSPASPASRPEMVLPVGQPVAAPARQPTTSTTRSGCPTSWPSATSSPASTTRSTSRPPRPAATSAAAPSSAASTTGA